MIRYGIHGGVGPALAVLLVIVGCRASGGPDPAGVASIGAEARSVVLVPLNVASELPVEVEASAPLVEETLVEVLSEHGKEVRRLRFSTARRLWIAATDAVVQAKLAPIFENGAKFYARTIARHVDYDLLVIPTLYIQNTTTRSTTVRWDGARQKIVYRGWPPDVPRQIRGGSFKAASLMLSILRSDGTPVLTRRRGLQLLEYIQFHPPRRGERFPDSTSVRPNEPPLDDPERVKEAIGDAIGGLFGSSQGTSEPPSVRRDDDPAGSAP